MKKSIITSIILGSMALNMAIGQTTVTTDFAKKYQTMDGFGTFSSMNDNWSTKFDAGFVDKLVNDLGANISRLALTHNFENTNDNNDANVSDLTKFNINSMKAELDYWKALKAANGNMKFIISIWTPPVWMKENGHACDYGDPIYTCGGRLRYDMYEEFAERCVAFIKLLKQETGIDLYAFSLQNELAFDQPFVSCVYTPQEFVNILKVVGPRFKKEGITTKIFGPEDIGFYDRVMQYINGALNDATAKQYIDIIAVHGYASNGITPNSPDAITWKNMGAPGAKQNKPFWMTETSGYGDDHAEGMKLGKAIYTALKWGQVSGWVWWQSSRNPTHPEGLWNQTANFFPPKYYASKQYYKFIRPGAVAVEVGSSDADILTLGFYHEQDKTMTYVLINNSPSASKTITLKNNNLGSIILPTDYASYRTSSTEKTASIGNVSASSTIALPANSITTLYGKNMSLATNDADNVYLNCSVYPNPATENVFINLSLNKTEKVKIAITDIVGKEIEVIADGNFKDFSTNYSVAKAASGLYHVVVNVEGQPLKIIKLVVE